MCGIWAVLGADAGNPDYYDCIYKINARGPEGMRHKIIKGHAHLSFSRLAINGLTDAGMQPFIDGDLHWVCNGEIYNWKELASKYSLELNTGSDCEVLKLANKLQPSQLFNELDGVFATVIYNEKAKQALVARDPFGVRPLYMWVGASSGGKPLIAVSSELKGFDVFKGLQGNYMHVMPGNYLVIHNVGSDDMRIEYDRYHQIPLTPSELDAGTDVQAQENAWRQLIKGRLEAAVKKRVLNTERPIAALLSGGVDSSLIAALVQKELRAQGRPPLKTFSIGFKGSSDLKYARMVADFIGSDHTEVIKTPNDFFAAIPEVINVIESYDTTTVRASVGNYLVTKAIREASDAKVVFNGDGSDEIFGSYLYFYRAPGDQEYNDEVIRLLGDIYMFDVLRSDRCISSNGLEPRTPFLDKSVVEAALSAPIEFRRPVQGKRIEKGVLRDAFKGDALLPEEVLYRRKEAFSDGVSGPDRAWYEEIKERLEGGVSEEEHYRGLYFSKYPEGSDINCPYKWLPKWSGETSDPSARTLSIYSSA
jgi:asparagine synthase (glutamine-hydrolysing)